MRTLLRHGRLVLLVATGAGPALLTDWLVLAQQLFPQHLPRIFGVLGTHEGVHAMCPGWCLCTDTATDWDALDELDIEAAGLVELAVADLVAAAG